MENEKIEVREELIMHYIDDNKVEFIKKEVTYGEGTGSKNDGTETSDNSND